MHSVWHISPNDFPRDGSTSDKIRFCVKYAILAPSAHNTQPWKYDIKDNQLHVSRDPAHVLTVGDPTLRETTLGIGAFIENFIIASEHFGLSSEVSDEAFRTSDELQAVISVTPGEPHHTLLDAIPLRHTNRGMYHTDPLPDALVKDIEALSIPSIQTFIIQDADAKERIATLVKKGVRIALSMRPMKNELAELVSYESDMGDTGMAVEALVENPHQAESGHHWVQHHMDPAADAAHAYERFAHVPAHVVIGTDYDGPLAWLRAGRVMERILLLATHYGYTHDISAAPVEVPPLAPLLRKEIDPNYRPQVLIRLGKPQNPGFTKASGRRSV